VNHSPLHSPDGGNEKGANFIALISKCQHQPFFLSLSVSTGRMCCFRPPHVIATPQILPNHSTTDFSFCHNLHNVPNECLVHSDTRPRCHGAVMRVLWLSQEKPPSCPWAYGAVIREFLARTGEALSRSWVFGSTREAQRQRKQSSSVYKFTK
jgi:hypothetical protein